MPFEDVLATARSAARAALHVHARHLGRVGVDAWNEKGTADFVTHVDREAEERIIACIRRAFPGHAILAEEGAADGDPRMPDAEWVWVVDPLDGTTNFLHRYPMYAVSIGILHEGEPAAGVVACGPTGQTWWGTRGGGSFLDGERIGVSTLDRLKLALIGTGFPFKAVDRLDDYLDEFRVVIRSTSGVRRAGAAAVDLCHLATGWLDGFWEHMLAPWDVAAGALIAREAGAVVTRLDGGEDILGRNGGMGGILAGNPAIHAALGTLLRERTDA